MIEEGQIVLFTFPHVDQRIGKVRPALLLRQLPGGRDDWLVCMISTQIQQQISGLDEVITREDSEFAATGLKLTSVVRVTRLAVVAAEILHGAIGWATSIAPRFFIPPSKRTISIGRLSTNYANITLISSDFSRT